VGALGGLGRHGGLPLLFTFLDEAFESQTFKGLVRQLIQLQGQFTGHFPQLFGATKGDLPSLVPEIPDQGTDPDMLQVTGG